MYQYINIYGLVGRWGWGIGYAETTDVILLCLPDMALGDGGPTEGKMSFPCFLPTDFPFLENELMH